MNTAAAGLSVGSSVGAGAAPQLSKAIGVSSDGDKSGLIAEVSGAVEGVTINELRAAFSYRNTMNSLPVLALVTLRF